METLEVQKLFFWGLCEQASETIEHVLTFLIYGPALETDWRHNEESNTEKQVEVGTFTKQRQAVLTRQEVSQISNSGCIAPDM